MHVVRTFTPLDLVQLPQLSAADAFALASQLLQRAAAERLPASMSEAHDELSHERDALQAELVARHKAPAADPQAARLADRAVDSAWGAFHQWLSGWKAAGPTVPHAEEIAALYEALFADGLVFLTLRHQREWTESEARLAVISKDPYRALVSALGGAPLRELLRSAQSAYGVALAITVAPMPESEALVGEALHRTLDVLRGYVVAVVASVRRSSPLTLARADRLLEPVTTWQSTAVESVSNEPTPPPKVPVA